MRQDIVDRIRDQVTAWHVLPTHAGLFGSFARGTAHADSDIDVLLVRPETLTEREEDLWLDQVDGLDRAIKAWTGNSAQVIDLTPATLGQMARKNDPLVDSWRAEGIHLYGERLI